MTTAQAVASKQFLTFTLGEDIFGVEVTQVREILDYTSVTKVPQTPDFMLGVINLRGSVVPVVDLRAKFGLPPVDKTRDTCIIVMEIEIEGESTVLGAVADAVQEVMDLAEEQIEPAPRIGTRLKTEFIYGMGKRDDQFIILLNIDKIFSVDELLLVQDATEQTTKE
ncbi:MAG: chemotaxis protein CheW [Desulfuromonadales bacterium]|nr:chemotaxis protein CheW [Desulfuromonadales bacterium]NIR33975.1 chemotaxis protein CheW [Desulfuromonadales bacterium]NIS42647.1 chemotaxis protein CheW [Desulfuromonadales bacterium]